MQNYCMSHPVSFPLKPRDFSCFVTIHSCLRRHIMAVAELFHKVYSVYSIVLKVRWRFSYSLSYKFNPVFSGSVLFYCLVVLDRSPHHWRTFSSYLCPLSFRLTLPRWVLFHFLMLSTQRRRIENRVRFGKVAVKVWHPSLFSRHSVYYVVHTEFCMS